MIGTTTNHAEYAGNASPVTAYIIPFRFDAASWVKVTVKNALGEITDLEQVTDYTLGGNGASGTGTFTTVAAVPATSTVTVYRETPGIQTLSLPPNTPLPATAMEAALDRLAMAAADKVTPRQLAAIRFLGQDELENLLNGKAPLASPTFTGTVSGITASMVGLGNVNNTSDANKPVSTAQQNAINLKANLASPALTGTPTAPTPALDDSSTRLATTEFVKAQMDSSGPAASDQPLLPSGVLVTGMMVDGEPIELDCPLFSLNNDGRYGYGFRQYPAAGVYAYCDVEANYDVDDNNIIPNSHHWTIEYYVSVAGTLTNYFKFRSNIVVASPDLVVTWTLVEKSANVTGTPVVVANKKFLPYTFEEWLGGKPVSSAWNNGTYPLFEEEKARVRENIGVAALLSTKLDLSGGTLDANATVTASTATTSSLFAGDTFGVELSVNPSENASLQYNGLQVQNFAGTMAVTASGLTFPNSSTQTTAFPGFNNAALTGNPTAPTPATSDDDTSIATTAFVKAQGFLTSAPVSSVAGKTGAVTLAVEDVSGAAPLASPALTGNVTIESNSTSPALTIQQNGTGDVVQFKDVASDTTFTFINADGKLTTIPCVTASAGFNIPHGTAPTSFVDGDIWTTTAGLFARIAGSTNQIMDLTTTQTVAGNKTFASANLIFGSSTAAGVIAIGNGATVSGSTKTVNILTNGLTGSTSAMGIGPVAGISTIDIGPSTVNSTLGLATGNNLTGATKTVNIGTGGTTGTTAINIGATAGTTITVNGSTTFTGASQNLGNSTSTTNILVGTGATVSGQTKTVTIGTNGLSGSTTTITIGSANGSTTTINGAINFVGPMTATINNLTLGNGVGDALLAFGTGATATGLTKAITIGTNGLSGSTTTITIGSTAGTSTTTLNGSTTLAGAATLSGATTVVGAASFTNAARPTAPNVSGSPEATSLMTRDDADTRYGTPYNLRVLTDVSATSLSNVNSSDTITLPAGTYFFQGNIVGLTASTTGGINVTFYTFSDTNTTGSVVFQSSSNIGTGSAANMTPRSGSSLFQYVATAFADAPLKACSAIFSGTVTFSTSQTITPRVSQRSVADATNAATLKAGSMVRFIKIA